MLSVRRHDARADAGGSGLIAPLLKCGQGVIKPRGRCPRSAASLDVPTGFFSRLIEVTALGIERE